MVYYSQTNWSTRPIHSHGKVVITFLYMLSVRPYVYMFVPTFQNLAKQKNIQVKIVIATSETVSLAMGIIDDDTCLVLRCASTIYFP